MKPVLFCPFRNCLHIFSLLFLLLCKVNQKPLTKGSAKRIYHDDLAVRIVLHQFLCCDTAAIVCTA